MKKLWFLLFLCLAAQSLQNCETVTAKGSNSDPSDTTTYTCAGKTQCSQMQSCREATYYLQHCPDTRIDGDMDGIPCEEQWCGNGKDL